MSRAAVLARRSPTKRRGYAAAVLADSPDVYYRLDETGSGPFVDRVGAHNATPNATIVSASSLLTSDADAAATFDHTASFFKAPTTYTLAQQPMTVEFLVKPIAFTTPGGWPVIVSCNTNASDGWAVQMHVTTGIWVFTTCGVNDYTFSAGAVIGTTQHVVFVFKANNDVDLYLNGSFSQTQSSGGAMTATTGKLVIGDSSALGRNPRATIDEVAVYKSLLSSTRIAAHYAAA